MVGMPDLIPYMFYFWKRDIDDDYYVRSPEYYAKQNFQRFIFAVNQTYVRDSIQSAFTNTSVFDRPYFEALFGGSQFPDGSYMIDYEEEIIQFQKWYMETMAEIRKDKMMTFPVSTISLLRQNGKFADEEFAEWAIRHNMQWADSNMFIDSSVTSLSNCCFDGKQKVLTKSSDGVAYMPIRDLYYAPYNSFKRNFTIFHNGSWVKGKPIKVKANKLYRVRTANNKEILVTADHINPTQRGDVQTCNLTTDDYLMFSTRPLNAVHEVDFHLTYEQGFLIGMYAGDGSMYQSNPEYETVINLSLNKFKYEYSESILDKALEIFMTEPYLGKEVNNVYPVRIISNDAAAFIRYYVDGNYSFEKRLNLNCLLQSAEFRRGILDGYYLTDGGNSNRIYTASPAMAECLEVLCTSLGLQTIIDISDRTNEPVIIRGEEFNRNFPLYCVRWYDCGNRRKLNNNYLAYNNSMFYKIVSITEYNNTDPNGDVYCFEMQNQFEPYFTLPNGIITHNCRLKSNIKDIGYFNSVGGTALKVGSVKVSTINLARIALDVLNECNGDINEDAYIKKLRERVEIDLIALDRVRHIIKRNVEKGLLPNFSYGLIDFEHLYNTIGFTGIYEAMKAFGYTYTDEFDNVYYKDEAYAFGKKIFESMRSVADEFIEKYNCDYMINTEQIPGESAADKLMQKDKFFYPDGDIYDLPLYGNQFIPLGIKTTMQERIKIASKFDSYCNGGSILHISTSAPFDTYEKARELVEYIADAGNTYFAFNHRIQTCHYGHAFFGKKCPVCGGDVETEYTRIVGFYTAINTWSKPRREEYDMRQYKDLNEVQVK